ncbi:MAG TPA: serine/threonine-protein kinase [Pirellulales bacterium]|nr:serine/threonine-protein kinase [Pirellulales bacterium]
MEPSECAEKPDAEQDLRIAEILELWQARRSDGETPDLLKLAGGDAALAEQLRQLVDVVRTIDDTGFASVGGEPVVAELAEHEAPSVPDFVVLKELGRGGMGVVYEARQVSLDRVVALKLLPLGTVDRAAAQRFAREAATAASLQHPSIVPIYATGEAPGALWYAMRRIDGESLAQLIVRHPAGIAWQRVVEIGIVAAEALMYAHQQGIVHRDVKPANLLEDSGGQIWLTDFGVARRDVDVTATLSQAICGTPRYMSPEQMAGRGELVDHRTDLYSLGATLYALATGRAVVQGTTPLEVLDEIRHGEPVTPRTLNPRLPRALEVVLLKCLEKSPRDRYATAADLLSDLKALADGRPIAARGLPVWTVWRRRLSRHASRVRLAALAATITIAVVGAGAVSHQYYVASRQAQVQISSAGGAYEAAIRPATLDGDRDDQVTSVALPMRQPLSFEAGDYEIAFAARGRFGERARLQLDAGDVAAPRYIDHRPPPPAIDVDQMWVSQIHAADEPGKLFLSTLSDRHLVIYAEGGHECFRLELSQPAEDAPPGVVGDGKVAPVPARRDDGETVAEGDRQLRHPGAPGSERLDQFTTTAELFEHIDFTYQPHAAFTGRRLARRPYLAQPQRVMPEAVDLNQDGELDFVIAARLLPIVAALDPRGNLLWASRVDVTVPSDAPPPWIGADRVQPPAVLQMLPTRDCTGDGTRDVLVVSMAIRSPPAVNPQAVNPQITLLSGRDGSLVWTTPLPPITAANGTRWPLAGLLEYLPYALDESRSVRSLSVQSNLGAIGVKRNLHMEDRRVQWSDRYFARLPVTPPIELSADGEHALVVTAASEARKLELASGRLREPIVLAPSGSVLATSPRTIRRGAGREPGILVDYLDDKAYGMLVGERLALYDPKTSKPLWSNSLFAQTNLVDPAFEQTDFPFVADLDHDGLDELVVAAADVAVFNNERTEIRCLDAETGNERWNTPVRVRCAELAPERICLVGDLDADGVDDLAIASLYGEAIRDHLDAIRTQRVNASIYIDVVSGRSGQRLNLAHQQIGEVDQFTRVVEIDDLRLASPGVVEASLVWGEGRERLLDSLSVRFSLTRDELPLVAPGLTALTRLSPSGGGYYLARPGPDDLGGETAVWIEAGGNGLLVAGYPWVLESWRNSAGEPRLLLEDRAMSRIAAVDVPLGRVLWRRTTIGTTPAARHLRRSNQDPSNQDCLLVQTLDFVNKTSSLACLDAETGRVRATLANHALGGMHDAALGGDGPTDVCVLTGPTHLSAASSRGFEVRKIALDTGKTAWEKSLLSGLLPVSNTHRPVKTLAADADGDGTTDCIVPDESPGNAIRLVAISGRDGQELWSCRTQLSMHEWPYTSPWPLMELASGGDGQSYLVFIDKRGSGEIAVRLLRLSDGRELDSRAYASDARRFGHLARDAGLSLSVERGGGAESIISVVIPENDAAEQLSLTRSRLQIREGRLHQAADGAARCERVVFTRDSLTGYGHDDDTIVWRRSQPLSVDRPTLIATSDPNYLIFRSEKSDTLLDLSTGNLHYTVPRVELYDHPSFAADGPTLLMKGATPHLVHQQRDGVRISSGVEATVEKSLTDARLAKSFSTPRQDPRGWRDPVASPLNSSDRTLTSLIASLTRGGVQSLFAFVLPLAGIVWLIRKRRFSLAQLSLAPLAALACLMTWHTMLTTAAPAGRSGQEPWFIVLFSGTIVAAAAAFVVRSIVQRRLGPLVGMVTLAAGMTAAVQWIPALLATDDVRYRLSWQHFLAGVIVALIVLLPPGLVIWSFVQFIARHIGRRAPHGLGQRGPHVG